MDLISVREKEEVQMFRLFYHTSAFTFEGIDISNKENMKNFKEQFEKIARETGFTEKKMIGYFYKGSSMNKHFKLTGDNAYPDDLTFVSIPNYYNPIMKLKMGARWFDDIVDNNSIRQRAIDGGIEPDFDWMDDDE